MKNTKKPEKDNIKPDEIDENEKLKNHKGKLREKAEKRFLEIDGGIKEINFDEAVKILYELQVHQIELEMQNEELRKTHLELDEVHNKYFELYNFAPVGYITLDEKGVITEANLTASQLIGVTKQEMKGKLFTNFIHKNDQDKYYLMRKSIVEANKSFQFDLRIHRNNKTYFWADINASTLSKERGKIFNVLTLIDATKRKEAEIALQDNDVFLNKTQVIAKLGTYKLDIKRDKWTSSDVLDKIFGIDKSFERTTNGWLSLVHHDWMEIMKGYFSHDVLGNKTSFDKEYKIIRYNDKAERWVHGSGELKFDENGELITMIGTIRDITSEKNILEIMDLKNKELEKVNSEKDKFFSIIAHDLRSPFNGFLGLTEMLSQDIKSFPPEELEGLSSKLYQSANNLFRLLTNLLNWSRIQRGLTELNLNKLHLKSIITNTLKLFNETADIKGVEITDDTSDNIYVTADIFMLDTILRNLISNALKFSNKGGRVIISSRMKDNKVEVSIKDTGIGMSQDILDNLFKIDKQTKRKGTDNEPGTGLGLILCKEFIVKHNGEMHVKSEEGKGSEFTIVLKN